MKSIFSQKESMDEVSTDGTDEDEQDDVVICRGSQSEVSIQGGRG